MLRGVQLHIEFCRASHHRVPIMLDGTVQGHMVVLVEHAILTRARMSHFLGDDTEQLKAI